MISESAVLCDSDKMLSDSHYAGAVLDLEFGSGNLEGDVSNPSFSTDVSDEEGIVQLRQKLRFSIDKRFLIVAHRLKFQRPILQISALVMKMIWRMGRRENTMRIALRQKINSIEGGPSDFA
jgi:hypothetical protein